MAMTVMWQWNELYSCLIVLPLIRIRDVIEWCVVWCWIMVWYYMVHFWINEHYGTVTQWGPAAPLYFLPRPRHPLNTPSPSHLSPRILLSHLSSTFHFPHNVIFSSEGSCWSSTLCVSQSVCLLLLRRVQQPSELSSNSPSSTTWWPN